MRGYLYTPILKYNIVLILAQMNYPTKCVTVTIPYLSDKKCIIIQIEIAV